MFWGIDQGPQHHQFCCCFSSLSLLTCKPSLPNKNDSLNLAVTDLTNILINLSKKCLKFKSRSNKKKRKKNEYFDSDCYSKRKELQRLGKFLSEKPNDINIRHSYFQTKKLYKNMKLKKRSFKENKSKLIEDLGHTDISQK